MYKVRYVIMPDPRVLLISCRSSTILYCKIYLFLVGVALFCTVKSTVITSEALKVVVLLYYYHLPSP